MHSRVHIHSNTRQYNIHKHMSSAYWHLDWMNDMWWRKSATCLHVAFYTKQKTKKTENRKQNSATYEWRENYGSQLNNVHTHLLWYKCWSKTKNSSTCNLGQWYKRVRRVGGDNFCLVSIFFDCLLDFIVCGFCS